MTPCDECDRSTNSTQRQLEIARAAAPDELRRLARGHDWSAGNEAVLGWIMAQRSVDLGTALTVFFNGGPERFNYLSKREVPQTHREAARLLDTICLRINSGFYLVRPGRKVERGARVRKWLEFQRADGAEGRRGRWILDEAIVEAALKGSPQRMDVPAHDPDSLRPLRGMAARSPWPGVDVLTRCLQRFLPRRG